MASGDHAEPSIFSDNASLELGEQWRRFTRSATLIAVLTSPAIFVWLYYQSDLHLGWALAWTFIAVILFRGVVDVIVRRFIPWPSLYGTVDKRLKEEDVVNRRRAWFWRKWIRRIVFVLAFFTLIWLVRLLIPGGEWLTWTENITGIWDRLTFYLSQPQLLMYAIIFPVFFLFNFLILLGPLMLVGITQMRGFEPGDADWGVRLGDVRGQNEAKEEVNRVVSLWQSGEAFEAAGGKRERGLLFLGPPGTGKTMLAKAIATGFNCPFVSMPGSGFQQTFMGMDAVIVRYLAWKAKRLAAKWGGQCIVFIDEIDAVGMRRSALGGGGAVGGMSGTSAGRFEDHAFYGSHGALNPSQDLILETRAWRDRLFEARAPESRARKVGFLGGIVKQFMPGMMGGGMGQLALNQLLVVMDGIDNPPFFKSRTTNWVNTFLDASYVVPRRIGKAQLRLRPPKPRKLQIYFIGATNVPINVLDPALIRPGRMGRHVWLRTPTKRDRLDIFDLYINKVDHVEELDSEKRRDEIARITNGYSPAMIEQVCSMALTLRALRPARALLVGGHRRGDDHDRVGHGDQDRVRPRGDASRGDPRGGTRGCRPCLHEGRRVDPSVDPPPRRRARPPPGAREGRALQLLAERGGGPPDLDARGDGRRAGVLRGELDGSRRRRAERHRPRRVDGRRLRDGPRADRDQRSHQERRGCRPGAQEDRPALRGDRDADHEPLRGRRPHGARPALRGDDGPRQALDGVSADRPGVRRRAPVDRAQP